MSEGSEILSSEQLRAAEEGFLRLLRAKRMKPQFIRENADDLLAQAQREYAAWCRGGRVAEQPAGWLIVCAWNRTKDLLEAQGRRPAQLSFDQVLHLADEQTPTPEEAAIDHDRSERILHAVGLLPEKERRLVYLTYFNGLDVKAAGRMVGWQKSTAHRHHERALKQLQSVLGRDFAAVEVALAAWVLHEVGAAVSTPDLLAGIFDLARDGTRAISHRATELARRASLLGDPASMSLTSTGAKVSGACAAAVAVACFASGVVGLGVGGLKAASEPVQRPAANRSRSALPASIAHTEPGPNERGTPTSPRPQPSSGHAHRRDRSRTAKPIVAAARAGTPAVSAPASSVGSRQSNPQFGIEDEAVSREASTPVPSGGSVPQAERPPTASDRRAAEGRAAATEFGM